MAVSDLEVGVLEYVFLLRSSIGGVVAYVSV